MKVVWGSSSGQAQEGRETCAFFFLIAFSLSIVLSERAKVNKAQEHRNDADRSRRHSAQNVRTASEKSTRNQTKIDENPCQINQKSTKYRWGNFGGSRPIWGRVRTRSGRLADGQMPQEECSISAHRSVVGPDSIGLEWNTMSTGYGMLRTKFLLDTFVRTR